MSEPTLTSGGDQMEAGLPQGVGRFGWRWSATVGLLCLLVAWGIFSYAQQRLHGDIVTGMRTIGAGGASWGLYISFYVIFVGFAFGGIVITTLAHLFHLRRLYPITRLADLVAVVSVICAAICIMADLGQPIHGLINLPLYAQTASPFFGSFTLIIGADFMASAVYEFLEGRADAAVCATRTKRFAWYYRFWASGWKNTPAERRRRRRVDFWLSLVMLTLLVVAYSTLGFIFGIQGGRPGWFSALAAPRFVVLAAVSGTGLVIVVAAAARHFMHLRQQITERTFRWLGNALWIGALIYLYLLAVEELTARYAADAAQTEVARAVTSGAYAPLFWVVVATLVLPAGLLFIQFLRNRCSITLTVIAGLLVNVAAILKRFLIVVPSQTHGQLLDYPTGTYSPSWVEYGTIIGITAVGALIFLICVKLYPLVPLAESRISEAAPTDSWSPGRRRLRRLLFSATLLTGLATCVIAFALSARYGTEPYLDPLLPGAPVLFIVGVVISLLSGAVYELIPDKPRTPSSAPD
jgi:molybdopterin-containing oxidoreductase family membrane subunit